MKSIKYLAVLITAFLLVGCASMFKPEMNEAQYSELSYAYKLAIRCKDNGNFNLSTMRSSHDTLNRVINRYTYDQPKLVQMTADAYAVPSRDVCMQLAQYIGAFNGSAPVATSAGGSTTITTTCSSYGGQFICTSN